MADSTLNAIRNKARRITHSLDENLLTTPQLDEYINSFILYNFPLLTKTFNLQTTATFFTRPNVDVYDTATTDVNDQMYQWNQRYVTYNPPVYIASRLAIFSQSPQEFYEAYPNITYVNNVVSGDGIATVFNIELASKPVIANNVLFSTVDVLGASLELHDDGQGLLVGDGFGTINYVTGLCVLNFNTAPAAGVQIKSQSKSYKASLPLMMLFYDSKFIIRPIPDIVYRVDIEATIRPTELLAANQSPEVHGWYEYIAYGAAKKVFEDRLDTDSLQAMMPSMQEQEDLVNRAKIIQNSSKQVATMFSNNGRNGFWNGWSRFNY